MSTATLTRVLAGKIRRGAITDADRLHWLEAEAEQLRQVFHAKRLAYLDAAKHTLMLTDTVVTAAHQAMNAAALDYAVAADFTAMARGCLGDAVV
jgi:hypothetical protein